MNVQSTHKWCSTLKSAVFGTSLSLPLLVSEGGRLVCESVGKGDLLSDHFDSKQSREAVHLVFTCHKSPSGDLHIVSGRIGKVVASYAGVARPSPAEVALIYTMHLALRGCCP